jgi:NADPH-dependent ferric siderophore reductase
VIDTIHLPVGIRHLEVRRVVDVTPRLRRVTLVGEQLGAFVGNGHAVAPFRSAGPDDHVKIFLTAPGQTEPVLPEQDDGHLDWPTDPGPIHRD